MAAVGWRENRVAFPVAATRCGRTAASRCRQRLATSLSASNAALHVPRGQSVCCCGRGKGAPARYSSEHLALLADSLLDSNRDNVLAGDRRKCHSVMRRFDDSSLSPASSGSVTPTASDSDNRDRFPIRWRRYSPKTFKGASSIMSSNGLVDNSLPAAVDHVHTQNGTNICASATSSEPSPVPQQQVQSMRYADATTTSSSGDGEAKGSDVVLGDHDVGEQLAEPVEEESDDDEHTTWQYLQVSISRSPQMGFGFAVSGGCDNPHFKSGDPSIVVCDVVPNGPASNAKLRLLDRIVSANGRSLDGADYNTAVGALRCEERLNLVVKRRVPVPVQQPARRLIKLTMSKAERSDPFGVELGCQLYVARTVDRRLARGGRPPLLQPGDIVRSVNGVRCDALSVSTAQTLIDTARERLTLEIERDLGYDEELAGLGAGGGADGRATSHSTVYEHLSTTGAQTPPGSDRPISLTSNDLPLAPAAPNQQTQLDTFRDSNEWFSQATTSSWYPPCGNEVGIFVSAVNSGSPAERAGLRQGDRILQINSLPLSGVTREEAVLHLLSLPDAAPLELAVQAAYEMYDWVRTGRAARGDSFCVRAHFDYHTTQRSGEMRFSRGDIMHVVDTLHNGELVPVPDLVWDCPQGAWLARRLTGAQNSDSGQNENPWAVIPNLHRATEIYEKTNGAAGTLQRGSSRGAASPSTAAANFIRRRVSALGGRTKSLSRALVNGDFTSDANESSNVQSDRPGAYERVTLTQPDFFRPVVLFGPLADVGRELLLRDYPNRFAAATRPLGLEEGGPIPLSAIDEVISAHKHCVLHVTAECAERLQRRTAYCPVVILVDVKGRQRLKQLRRAAGPLPSKMAALSCRQLLADASRLRKKFASVFSATLDATGEDRWFQALVELIAHLQTRRVWSPERPAAGLDDDCHFMLQQPGAADDNQLYYGGLWPNRHSVGSYGTLGTSGGRAGSLSALVPSPLDVSGGSNASAALHTAATLGRRRPSNKPPPPPLPPQSGAANDTARSESNGTAARAAFNGAAAGDTGRAEQQQQLLVAHAQPRRVRTPSPAPGAKLSPESDNEKSARNSTTSKGSGVDPKVYSP